MIDDALKAVGQMSDQRFRGVLLRGVGLSAGILLAFSLLLIWGVQWLIGPTVTLPWLGEIGWLDDAAGLALIPVSLLLSVFLMVPVASAFTGLFLDRIAEAVEDRHYPGLPPARRQPVGEMLRDTAAFLGLVVGVNLLALLAYVVLAPLALFIFWGVNGLLLGREYAQMSAARRLPLAEAKAFRRRHRGAIWATGVLMAIPLSVPVVNLLVPILGAATFTHLFHRLSGARS
ncbi:membrane protein [Jannaschia pagri]|uniref:Membrane protein n=1 Tax=Jannaschia pagri TaxID=2829797 RepID=A0ABQ4NKG8_9RHOB|nr:MULTISPECIES: EI24 domain-containing protein [unclassified Jannaschia]GIT91047.1 membrane protein [Jannaschia sp. AI_61]GIT94879.1 membrane protein [Jannaschia sp. AI_62]